MEERNEVNRGNSNTFGLEDEAANSDNSTIKDETPIIGVSHDGDSVLNKQSD